MSSLITFSNDFLLQQIKDGQINSLSRISTECSSGTCYFLVNHARPESLSFVVDAVDRGAIYIVIHHSFESTLLNSPEIVETFNCSNLKVIATDDVLDLLAQTAKLFFSHQNPHFPLVIAKIAAKYQTICHQSLLIANIASSHESFHDCTLQKLIEPLLRSLERVLQEPSEKVKTLQSNFHDLKNIASFELFLVAVTGTSGKTTTAYLGAQMLAKVSNGALALYCGTLGLHLMFNSHILKLANFNKNNTPDVLEMHEMLLFAKICGISAIFFEASSHGLVQQRLSYIPVDVAVITNIGSEHLDYHLNLKNYSLAKKILFTHNLIQKNKQTFAVIHNSIGKNEYLCDLLSTQSDNRRLKCIEYCYQPYLTNIQSEQHLSSQHDQDLASVKANSASSKDLSYFTISDFIAHTSFTIQFNGLSFRYYAAFPVLFFVENFLAAACAVIAFFTNQGVPFEKAAQSTLIQLTRHIRSIIEPPGRMQLIPNPQGLKIYIDYAHKEDALRSILNSINLQRDQHSKIWLLFGCGGDRDKSKRFAMGAVARELSDFVVITDDNLRSEDSATIRAQIVLGYCGLSWDDYQKMQLSDFEVQRYAELEISRVQKCKKNKEKLDNKNISRLYNIANRSEAIKFAINNMAVCDILILAGKGHETEQIIGNSSSHYSEYEEALKVLSALSDHGEKI